MTAFATLALAGAGTAEAKSSHSHKSECKKEAQAQGLKGDEAKKFVKECTAKKKEHKDEAAAPK